MFLSYKQRNCQIKIKQLLTSGGGGKVTYNLNVAQWGEGGGGGGGENLQSS